MSERMTSVLAAGTGHPGFAFYGRVDPVKAIADLRAMAERERDAAQAVIDAPDSAFCVETYTGVHIRRNVRRLWPDREVRT